MKKNYIAMAALVAVTLISCQREKSFNDTPLEKNEFRIALYGSASTRAQESMEPKKFSYLAGKDEESGESYYLEEVVEDLNYVNGPATKGTPVYTENVGKLYHNMIVVAKGGESDIETNFWAMDDMQRENAGWRYQGMFDWKKDSYDFYMSMPEDMTSKGVSGLTYGKNDSGKQTITFNYTTPESASATDLQDLIFAARSITKTEAENNRVEGVPVLFHHALTGVKFRIANNDELDLGEDGNPLGKTNRTQTYITKVTIRGLKNSGTCTITPREETQGYVDDRTGDYSSGDGTFTTGVVAWSYNEPEPVVPDPEADPTSETEMDTDPSQIFTEAQNLTVFTGNATGGSFQNNGNYPSTFSGAGNTYNLNDADASMTFWFIPQALTADVTIEVEFHVWSGEKNEKTNKLTLNLGKEVLKKTGSELALTRDWKAGQLRTFSLKPLNVNVKITDKMTKYIKSDVVIKNTGNVSEYVRVYMIGNWVGYRQIGVDEDGKPIYNDYETVLMGFKSAQKDEHGLYVSDEEVERWNDKDFTWEGNTKVYPDWTTPNGTYAYEPYGIFDGLPPMGSKTAGGTEVNNWIRHDKFYYYTLPIGPGDQVPNTSPLFSSYEVGKSPVFYIPDNWGERRAAKNVHLVMDISVQAIEAPIGQDGQPTKTYLEAWTAALNPNNADPNFNINDL